ncbi:variable surface protein [Plasmodium gonderi]|uniref:Variable surface protein n=1 Tax=Plasmodium gonderi TaxID=77519 RepID=A0A1Y1JWD5_PLAGO|nr:variable surface protein [Plasmodium gonderi]GAW84653.1 variable surface protein [Plasmodium gonderi]
MAETNPEYFNRAHLPSVKFYDMLNYDRLSLLPKDFSYCKGFSGSFVNPKKVKEICSKYVTYLTKQKQIRHHNSSFSEHCNLISYWVSEELLKTLENDDRMCSIAFGQIQLMWSNAYGTLSESSDIKCLPYNSILSYYHIWENTKKLYDYYVDYSYLYSIASKCSGECENLCTYLKGITDAYDSFKGRCRNSNKTICPIADIKYEDYDPKKLMDKASCYPNNQESLSEPGSHEEQALMGPENNSLDDTALPPNDYYQNTESISNETKHLSAFGNSFLGLVLTSMLFVVLYKYTPIGKQFQNKFPTLANMINKLNGKEKGIFTYRSETFSPFREYLEENYIEYNPV